MGRDKALIQIDGQPMARRVADALVAAGASEVIAVGGDASALRPLGLTVVNDDPAFADQLTDALDRPTAPNVGGERSDRPLPPGPLVGVVTALGAAPTDIVLVVSCDLISPSAAAMAATVAALVAAPEHDLAVPQSGPGRGSEASDRSALVPPGPPPSGHDQRDSDGDVPQWLHAAWRVSVRAKLVAQLQAGERSIHRAVVGAGLRVATVRGVPAAALQDADVPAQLPRQAD